MKQVVTNSGIGGFGSKSSACFCYRCHRRQPSKANQEVSTLSSIHALLKQHRAKHLFIPFDSVHRRSVLIRTKRNASVMKLFREWNIFLMLPCANRLSRISIGSDFNFSSLASRISSPFPVPGVCARIVARLGEKFPLGMFLHSKVFSYPFHPCSAGKSVEWRLAKIFSSRALISLQFSYFSRCCCYSTAASDPPSFYISHTDRR